MHALCLDKVSPEMKLVRRLNFQLCLPTTALVDASPLFAFQMQRVSSQFHMILILVLRIKQHEYGLAQSINLIIKVTVAGFQTTEMYP